MSDHSDLRSDGGATVDNHGRTCGLSIVVEAQKTHVVGGGPPTPYNKTAHRLMPPWYSGRMPENEVTLAKVLRKNGYVTGHCGKWHMAINHNAFPQPGDVGFDSVECDVIAVRGEALALLDESR